MEGTAWTKVEAAASASKKMEGSSVNYTNMAFMAITTLLPKGKRKEPPHMPYSTLIVLYSLFVDVFALFNGVPQQGQLVKSPTTG